MLPQVELTIVRGEGLLGDSFLDKLDSFVIVKPGTGTEISREDKKGLRGVGFRTPTQVTESVIALAVTILVGRCCSSRFTMLAVKFWL